MNESIRFAEILTRSTSHRHWTISRLFAEGIARSLLDFKPVPVRSQREAKPDERQFLTAAKEHQEYLDQKVFGSATNSPWPRLPATLGPGRNPDRSAPKRQP